MKIRLRFSYHPISSYVTYTHISILGLMYCTSITLEHLYELNLLQKLPILVSVLVLLECKVGVTGYEFSKDIKLKVYLF